MNNNQNIQSELIEIKAQLKTLLNNFQPQFSKYSFYEWLSEWLKTYKKPYVAKLTYKDIVNSINLHIKPQLKDINLNSLTSLDIQNCLNNIEKTRMRKLVYHIFNNALNRAYKLKIINDNIMLNVEPVKHKCKNGRALTTTEQKQLLEIVKHTKYEIAYKMYLLTGCRRNEIFLIKWSDIDFKKNVLHIVGTKTKFSDRFIPLFPQLKQLLKDISKNSDYVVNITCNAIKCHFRRIKANFNLSYSIHSLRHTFATRCLEQGISMKVVQKWLGHSRIDTTANIYSHILSEFEINETKKFNINI